jgi:hypothetical protein
MRRIEANMMTRGAIRGMALALPLAFLVGACESVGDPALGPTIPLAAPAPMAAPTPMDGTWASTDGIFVASFQGGSFISRYTKTNEVLAQGTYSVSGTLVNMQWMSVAAQQHRSAICAMTAQDAVRCNQSGGGSFDLTRAI